MITRRPHACADKMPVTWNFSVDAAGYESLNIRLLAYFRRLAPANDPHDLAAETWLAIVRCYKGECSLRRFAFIVAHRQIVGIWRKRKRQLATRPLPEEGSVDTLPSEGPNLDNLLMLVDQGAAVERALEHLTDVYREVVVLSMEGLNPVQIAAQVDAPYNTVRSRLARGKAQLASALQEGASTCSAH